VAVTEDESVYGLHFRKECVDRSLSWMIVSNVVVNECEGIKLERVAHLLSELHQHCEVK